MIDHARVGSSIDPQHPQLSDIVRSKHSVQMTSERSLDHSCRQTSHITGSLSAHRIITWLALVTEAHPFGRRWSTRSANSIGRALASSAAIAISRCSTVSGGTCYTSSTAAVTIGVSTCTIAGSTRGCKVLAPSVLDSTCCLHWGHCAASCNSGGGVGGSAGT